MSEGYTTGGDSWAKLTFTEQACQTFRLPQTIEVNYVDVYVKFSSYMMMLDVSIYYADADHHPFGDPLSRGDLFPREADEQPNPYWKRIRMSSAILLKDEYYALKLNYSDLLPPSDWHWRYDADDAFYPRGVRSYSTDAGLTWQTFFNDDHLFVVWGTPPIPHALKPPPFGHFSVLSISQNITPEGVIIVATTDVPAHIYMSWTVEPPWVHRREVIRRGVPFMDAAYWCFIHYRQLEQIEQGITHDHTFFLTDWPICQTRWFYFFGQIYPPLESWHKQLTDNNPWLLVPTLNPPDHEIIRGCLSLSSTDLQARGIELLHPDPPLPLIDDQLRDLRFNARFTLTEGNPDNHAVYLTIHTMNTDDDFLLYLLISRGNVWAHAGSDEWVLGHTGGIGYGQGPYFLNLRQLWVKLRRMADLDTNPVQWEVDSVRLALYQSPAGGTNKITNDWLDFYYYPFGGIVKSQSPIFEKHYPGYLPTLLLSEPWSWKGDQPPDFVLLLDEPWSWKGEEPPDFVLLFTEEWTAE